MRTKRSEEEKERRNYFLFQNIIQVFTFERYLLLWDVTQKGKKKGCLSLVQLCSFLAEDGKAAVEQE